jgi:hypothetical protein
MNKILTLLIGLEEKAALGTRLPVPSHICW